MEFRMSVLPIIFGLLTSTLGSIQCTNAFCVTNLLWRSEKIGRLKNEYGFKRNQFGTLTATGKKKTRTTKICLSDFVRLLELFKNWKPLFLWLFNYFFKWHFNEVFEARKFHLKAHQYIWVLAKLLRIYYFICHTKKLNGFRFPKSTLFELEQLILQTLNNAE